MTKTWRRSSSCGGTPTWVEVRWRKASFSGHGNDCVELAHTLTAVRDSKAGDGGPVLAVSETALRGLVRFAR